MAARNEVLAVQVERDRAELDRLRAQSGAEVAEANLLRLLELAASTRVECTEALSENPASPEDLEGLVALAVASRPEIGALESRAAALDASARAQRAAALPQVSLSAGYDYANPNTRILPLFPNGKGHGVWESTSP